MTAAPTQPQPQPPQAPPPAPPRRAGWNAGRLTGAIGGGIVAAVGLLIVLGGLALVAVHAFARDDDGFYTSGTELLESDGYAIATENIDLGNSADDVPGELLGRLRVRAESSGAEPVFIGIAPRTDVLEYLGDVEHSVLTDVDDPEYREVEGGRPDGPPSDQGIWAAEAEGRGEQVLEWEIEGGEWSVVFMNADGGRDVAADAGVGIEIDWLLWAGIGLLLVGAGFVAGGSILVVIMSREASGPA